MSKVSWLLDLKYLYWNLYDYGSEIINNNNFNHFHLWWQMVLVVADGDVVESASDCCGWEEQQRDVRVIRHLYRHWCKCRAASLGNYVNVDAITERQKGYRCRCRVTSLGNYVGIALHLCRCRRNDSCRVTIGLLNIYIDDPFTTQQIHQCRRKCWATLLYICNDA